MLKSKALFAPQAWSDSSGLPVPEGVSADRRSGRGRARARLVVRPPPASAASSGPIGASGPSASRFGQSARFSSRHGPGWREPERSRTPPTSGVDRWAGVASRQMGRGRSPTAAAGARPLETAGARAARWDRLRRRNAAAGRRVFWRPPKRLTSRWPRGPESRPAIGCARRSTACVSRIRSMHQPGRDLQATLRPYQAAGVRWLWFMTELGLGACLADDMGLGKTIQVIDLLLQRKRADARGTAITANGGPSLLVVPASLDRQLAAGTGPVRPDVDECSSPIASECDAETLARVAADPSGGLPATIWSITTYGLVRAAGMAGRMSLAIGRARRGAGDQECQVAAKPAASRSCAAAGRIVLTGTPVENQLGDLWSLFDFCSPGCWARRGEFKKFVKRLSRQQDPQAFGTLRRARATLYSSPAEDRSGDRARPAGKDRNASRMRTCRRSRPRYTSRRSRIWRAGSKTGRRHRATRPGAGGADATQADLRSSGAVSGDGRVMRRARAGSSSGCGCSASRSSSGRRRCWFSRSSNRDHGAVGRFFGDGFRPAGLVLHGGTPVGKRTRLVRTFQDATSGRRFSSSRSRPAAAG